MKTIALFLHDPECSEDCVNAMVKALSPNYNIKIFSEDDFNDINFFNGIDVIAFPGGIGDSDVCYKLFTRRNANRIAKFVEDGGHYLGICMGAYWADQWYFDLIDDVRAVQYIKRPNADVKRSYGTVATVEWKDKQEKMYFYDGCALVGDETKFKTIGRYANGDPMAIIQGRVGLIGCHPEAPLYWYQKPWNYINKYWNDGKHHTLLLEFANELTET
jgi:glutamine amidotransferase-like uncharacterized protein